MIERKMEVEKMEVEYTIEVGPALFTLVITGLVAAMIIALAVIP